MLLIVVEVQSKVFKQFTGQTPGVYKQSAGTEASRRNEGNERILTMIVLKNIINEGE